MPNHYTTIAICSSGYDFDCDAFNAAHEKTNICDAVRPMPKELCGTSAPGDKPNWYDWANDNWSTKWGTYDVRAFKLGGDGSPVAIKFQSAWSAPKILKEIAEWLKRVGGFDKVSFVGFDPYDDSTKVLT